MVLHRDKVVLCILSLLGATYSYSHDPSEHTGEAEKPQCDAVKNVNPDNVDANDFVMQAIIKKCAVYNDGHNDNHNDELDNATAEDS